MRKILTILLFTLLSMQLKAYSNFKAGGFYYRFIGNGEVELVANPYDGCVFYSGNMVVPDSVEYNGTYYKVTSIGDRVFNCATIESIVLPEGIRAIGEECFVYADFFQNIKLPDSLKIIKRCAFGFSRGLDSLFIPASCETIESAGLYLMYGVRTIEVDSANRNYCSNDGVLYNKNMTELIQYPIERTGSFTIPNGVEIIIEQAFAGAKLDTIVISPSVSTIKVCAFSECGNLKSVNIPSTVRRIEGGIFRGCHQLANVVIDPQNPSYRAVDNVVYSINMDTLFSHHLAEGMVQILEGVKVIAEDAFTGSRVDEAILPEGVEEIQDAAFRYTILMTIHLPQTLRKIGAYAFQKCEALERIDIPNSVVEMGDYTFYDCFNLLSARMSDSIKYLPEEVFSHCISLSSYTGGASVERIGSSAFLMCQSFQEKIVFPENLKYIGFGAFTYTPLTDVEFTGIVDTIGRLNFESLRLLVLKNNEPPFTYNEPVSSFIFRVNIPCGATKAYKAEPSWNSYTYVEDCDGIEESEESNVRVVAKSRSIEVLNAVGCHVAIYDAMGRCLVNEPANGNSHRYYNVPTAGVYVVRVDDRGYKVVVSN